ncbi:hypothetical protein RA210_U20446 [Rubrivivax sp. A210]|uniref:glycosyltransferase n=1 Tax=Rubrivivax sp. A210 TaxID=2772301 RepID=UPI001918BCF8|nr:glycosyltransferase [Rubrivivax sp. A210]CAD5372463.1 hypothetical protein RA210_U20446 [Rubrivivax sp. A210]
MDRVSPMPPAPEAVERQLPADDAAPRRGRFLLIEPCGRDFWLNVQHVVAQLLVAQLDDRRPVVHWPLDQAAGAGAPGNAFEHFFEAVSPLSLAMLVDATEAGSVYPPAWRTRRPGAAPAAVRLPPPGPLGRSETLVVSDRYLGVGDILPSISGSSPYFGWTEDRIHESILASQLRPVPAIVQKVEAFARQRLAGRPWVAVHVPGRQGSAPAQARAGLLAQSLSFVDRIVELNPRIGVLLLSADSEAIAGFGKHHGARLVCPAAERPGALDGARPPGWADRAGAEAQLIDALLAARCHYLVGDQAGGLSQMASRLRSWPRGQVFLLGMPPDAEGALPPPSPRDSDAPPGAATQACCRLCGGALDAAPGPGLGQRRGAALYRCAACHSLQAGPPQEPGHAGPGLAAAIDTGRAARTLAHAGVVPALLQALPFRQDRLALDIGSGLFTRLMRDAGYNFHCLDSQAAAEFAAGFRRDGPSPAFDLVTLREGHGLGADPARLWQQVFACDPDLVIGELGARADTWNDPWNDPWNDTQHGTRPEHEEPGAPAPDFLYSRAALDSLAQRAGRQAYHFGNWFIFSRRRLGDTVLGRLQAWHDGLPAHAQRASVPPSPHSRTQAAADLQTVTAFERLRASGLSIAIDGVFFCFTSGIARVWKSLLQHWSVSDLAPSLVVIDRGRTAPRLPGLRYVDAPPYDYARMVQDRALMQQICNRERAGLFVSTYFTQPLTTPSALMVHDMIPEVMGFDLTNLQWVGKRLAIASAQAFLCVSHSTEADLLRFHPQARSLRRRVVHNGCSFEPADAVDVASFRQRHGITRPYFMVSGSRTDYKNVELFFRAFARLGDERSRLAIVCTNANAALEPEMAALTGDAAVHMLVLSDHELQCAYSGALALVYPSRYEGFGLPVVEAMACACPAITCRNSSLGEVGGEAALYVGEDSIDEMHQALRDVQVPGTRSALVALGLAQAATFSWTKMAREAGLALATWAVDLPGPV